MDCSGFIYTGLRHLNVRFTGFYDGNSQGTNGRIGPIPVAPYGYVDYYNDNKPYHIKWENGDEIAKITDFTSREHWDQESETYIIDCSYGEWIKKEEIAPGTIVVSPPAEEGKNDHAWLYIGEFDSRDDIVKYLTDLGIDVSGENGKSEGIRVFDEDVNSKYWSIECRGNYNGSQGVVITNRDPASLAGNKKGSGYVGFSFLVSSGEYKISIDKKDSNTNASVSGAVINTRFHNDNTEHQLQTPDVTTNGQRYYLNPSNEWNNDSTNSVDIKSSSVDVYAFKETTAPTRYKPNVFNDYICLAVHKNRDGSVSYIEGIDVHRGSSTGGDKLNNEGILQSSDTNQTWYIQYISDALSLTQTKPDNSNLVGKLVLGANGTGIDFSFYNEPIKGGFILNLIKTVKGEQDPNDESQQKKLAGAKFKITIKEGDKEIYNSDSVSTEGLETDEDGRIPEITGLDITAEGVTYTITVEELSAPEGYIGLGKGNVRTFTAKSTSDGKNYKLVPQERATIENDSNIAATVNPGEILIEVENRKEPEIHKGVKTVENQDSGYDKNETQTWVINSSIPAGGLKDYAKYIVTDTIDYEKSNIAEKRLTFINEKNPENNVVVKYKGTDTVLQANTDYKVEFDEAKKVLTVIFIGEDKDGNKFTGGKTLTEKSTIEITYKTKFRLDDNGNIIGINQSIPNRAHLTFNGNGEENKEKTKSSEKPEIHTGEVRILKYDETTNKALQGAHFKITKTKAEADKAVQALLANNAEALKSVDFVKEFDANGNKTDKDLEVVTGADGKARFQGLEFGEDAINKVEVQYTGVNGAPVYKYDWSKVKTDYYIVETEVPDGYILKDESIPVEVKYTEYNEVDLTGYHRVGNIPKGGFKLNLIKTVKGEQDPNDESQQKKLAGAKFKITIKEGDKEIYNSDNVSTEGLETGKDGYIPEITGLDITAEGVTYTITVEELSAPEGYIGLGKGNVRTFTATSTLDGTNYKLVPQVKTTIENDSNIAATVKANEILIEVENRKEPEIHKGVKTVENQDSGYDKNETQTWVINTTVPAGGLEDYTKYVVTDTIDYEKANVAEKRIKFIDEDHPGNNVIVKYKDTQGALTLNTDYKVSFDKTQKILKVTFIGDVEGGKFEGGKHLRAGSTIEITFKTKFRLDDNGNIIGINQPIPNQSHLTFNGNGREDITKDSEKPEVHTGGVGVFKFDDANNNGKHDNNEKALVGAKFKIARTEADAKANKFVQKLDENGNAIGDWEITTNKDGYAEFEGLEFGEDAKDVATNKTTDPETGAVVYTYDWSKAETKYYLVETEAPSGYQLLTEVFEVKVKADSYEKLDLTKYYEVNNHKKTTPVKVKVVKTDLAGNELSGGLFQVDLGTEEKGRVAANGEVNLGNFAHGSSIGGIYVKELDPPSGYINVLGNNWCFAEARVDEDGKVVVDPNLGYTNKVLTADKNGERKDLNKYFGGVTVDEETNTIVFKILDPKHSSFNINLVKYKKDTTEQLDGAEFNITVRKCVNGVSKDQEEIIYQNEKPLVTKDGGKIATPDITIENAGQKYRITVEETKAPNGYIGIDGEIEFFAESVFTESVLQLIDQDENTTFKNAKKVDINPNEILIEAENTKKTTPVKVKIEKKDMDSKDLTGGKFKIYYENADGIINDAIEPIAAGESVELGNFEWNSNVGSIFVQEVETPTDSEGNKYYNGLENMWCFTSAKVNHLGIINKGDSPYNDYVFANDKNGIISKKHENKYFWEAIIQNDTIVFQIKNPKITGEFGFSLVKYEKDTAKALENAKFTLKIEKIENGAVVGSPICETTGVTDSHGGFYAGEIPIGGEGEEYQVTLHEDEAPLGYKAIDKDIVFNVTTVQDKDKYKLQPDDMVIENTKSVKVDENWIYVEVENTPLIFDLALRKSIIAVNGENPNPGRLPYYDVFSETWWHDHGTLAYYHTKEAVTVKKGDIVKYRINVYNEANTKGYARVIADYLPEGLEFIDPSESDVNKKYGWSLEKNPDGTVKKDGNGTTTIKTAYLSNTRLDEFKGVLLGTTGGYTTWTSYVEVECKVVKDPTEETVYLTNRAEITVDDAVQIDSEGKEHILDIEDRDSEPGNVKTYHEKDMLDYDNSIAYSTDKYYEGFQDDDDKETITLNPKKHYEFILNKVDDKGNPLEGAEFILQKEIDGEFVTLFRKTVNGTASITEPHYHKENDVELNKTYTYKVMETNSKDGYENTLDGKYILVKTYMNESKQMVRGVYGDNDENSYYNKYGFEIYMDDGTLVSDTQTDLYQKIKFDPEHTTQEGVYPPAVSLTIPNEKIITGKYRIKLSKVDGRANKIAGIPFLVGETKKYTSEKDGTISITDENSNEGYVTIDKTNYSNIDTYTIQEVEDEVPAGYVVIKDPITLDITKSFDDVENYYVSNIKVHYTSKDGEQIQNLDIDKALKSGMVLIDDVLTIGGGSIKVVVNMDSYGNITIKAQNEQKTGEYNLRALKINKTTRAPIGEISFKVNDDTVQTDSRGYTREIYKIITKQNLSETDVYTITELPDEKGRAIEIKNPIELRVTKTENPKQYLVNTIQIAEQNTSNVSEEVGRNGIATLSGVAINDDTGRTITVTANMSDANSILLTVENVEPVGKINMKIKKVNSATGEALNGVTFKVTDEKQIPHTATTANEGDQKGIAYLEKNKDVSSAQSYIYTIEETEIPSEPANLMKLTDFGLSVRFDTIYDKDKKTYIVNNQTLKAEIIELRQDSNYEIHERQRAIAQKAADSAYVSEDGATIVITMENEPITNYSVNIKKADIKDNTPIANAKFTIYEDGKIVKYNGYLGESSHDNGGLNISKTNMLAGTTHTYDIYETEAAPGYVNMLENVYIRLVVNIDNQGNATAEYTINKKAGATDEDVQKVEDYIAEYKRNTSVNFLNSEDNNRFVLFIPNPKDTIDIDLNLRKHELGDITKRVGGAMFNVRMAKIEADYKTELSEAMDALSDTSDKYKAIGNPTTSKHNEYTDMYTMLNAEYGGVWYYQIREDEVPKNFKSMFKKILVRIEVNMDGTISASIPVVDSGEGWIPYSEEYANHVSVEVPEGTRTVNINWANSLSYNFRIQKKSYANAIPEGGVAAIEDTIGGASFTISRNGLSGTLVDGLIHPTEVYEQNEVHSDTMYTYMINENSAPSTPTKHFNIFENIDIKANIYVGSDGTLSKANSSIKLTTKQGRTVTPEEMKEAYDSIYLDIDTNTNTATVMVANKQIHNTFDVKIMKVSQKKDGDENLIGIPGIKFSVLGTQQEIVGTGTTGEDGTITIPGFKPKNTKSIYTIVEDRDSAIAQGATPLSEKVILNIDTTGIFEDDSIEDISTKLGELVDGKSRVSVELDSRDSDKNAIAKVVGNTIIITIDNPIVDYTFNLYKQDTNGSLLHSDINGPGASFDVTYKNNNEQLISEELMNGYLSDFRNCVANTTYEYIVRETEAKPGYINILEGYDLHVYLVTDDKGVVHETQNNGVGGYTHFTLSARTGETQKYTIDEILENEWVKLSVARNETDAIVSLIVKNPYEYKLQLNKKDKSGNLGLDVATIVAEKIEVENLSNIYENPGAGGPASEEAIAATLNAIATETNILGSVTLDKAQAKTSEEGYMIDLTGSYTNYNLAQLWRIKETDVNKPYVNILGNNSIIVGTYYNGNLEIARHYDYTAGKYLYYYVIDEQGNDVTLQYEEYVEVSTQQIDGEWTLIVTVKDPLKVKLKLFKSNYAKDKEPLAGATLKMAEGSEGGANNVTIADGAYKSDELELELYYGQDKFVYITEDSTVKGHTNILQDKILIYKASYYNKRFNLVFGGIVDKKTGQTLGGEALGNIMKYVSTTKYTSDDEYPAVEINIGNPTSYEFNLKKLKLDNSLLEGAQIEVNSSHSGKHYLNKKSSMTFTEEDVGPHDVITYVIREISTVQDSAYINKFNSNVRITVMMTEDGPTIVKKEHEVLLPNGSRPYGEFTELEYFNCYITPDSASKLNEGEKQTIVVELQNPPQIEVEVIKTTAGENSQSIRNAKFTVESQETHTEYTDENGKINFFEEIHKPGVYIIKVFEDEPANKKYINVLENKYMKLHINVAEDGLMSTNTVPIYYNKDDDTEVDAITSQTLAKYCSMYIDDTQPVNKLVVKIQNPVTYDIEVLKEKTDHEELEGATFDITSPNFGVKAEQTNEDGRVTLNESWINPGVYKYEVTERETPGSQYDNVLLGHKIVAYVKVGETGTISVASDEDGNEFASTVKEGQRYYVQKEDGSLVDEKAEAEIRKYCSISIDNSSSELDKIIFRVENPVNHKINIIKKQLNNNGEEIDLAGTRFTVIKNGSEIILDNAEVTSLVELEEHYLDEGDNYYDIYENSSSTEGAYVNILQNKFIRIYTETRADGKLTILDAERDHSGQYGDNKSYYFEVYEVQHMGAPRLLSRADNKELYESIYVSSEDSKNRVYTLNIKVLNPITINVGVKKTSLSEQENKPGMPIPDVSINIISDITGLHDITTKSYETVFSEGNIMPGTYNFIIKENNNPNPRYVNILENRYAKVNITVSEVGMITINNVTYYADNGDENYENDALIRDSSIISMLNEYVHVTVDETNHIKKLCINIENPVTLKFVVNKVDLDGTPLEGTKFNVTKYDGGSESQMLAVEKSTKQDGDVVVEDGEIMKPGIYRYEVTEITPPGKQYVNILDCFSDEEKYKVVVFLKLNPNGTTELVKDANGTPFESKEQYKYLIKNRADSSDAPDDVTKLIRKYVSVNRIVNDDDKDKITVRIENPPQIDVDIIKTTVVDGEKQPLAGTTFSACMDDANAIFQSVVANNNTEHRLKNIESGDHIFYITENESVVNGGFINILEGRYIKVYTHISADGVLTIKDNNGNNNANYFEIYQGNYNAPKNGGLLDKTQYADIYEKIKVSSVLQDDDENNGVYKLNIEVQNPERNYKVVLNKKLFGEEDINIEGTEFYIRSGVDNQVHQMKTDKDGNLSFEEKQVPVGQYNYLITETKSAGEEFINVLEENYILVSLRVYQDGTVKIVDLRGVPDRNEGRYYILNEDATSMISFGDTVVDEYVSVKADNDKDAPELDLLIEDPQYYNFKLIKKDKDTNEKMNGVKFTLTVYGPDGQAIQLVDANTLQKIDNRVYETANVNGMDGVISIPNILVNQTGTYTFAFHEESTDGLFDVLYKSHAEDIRVNVHISVGNRADGKGNKYIISTPIISTGAKYVDFVETTSTAVQTVSTGVTNERIKGSYNLKLFKLDKETLEKLNGAEFNITVKKDGQEYRLYKSTDDVESKDVIIPGTYTLENGELKIENIRIERPETYTITLTETKAPKTPNAPNGYMLLDEPIVLQVTTDRYGQYDDERYVLKDVKLVSGDNHGLVTFVNTSREIEVAAKNEYFDLALRKSITSVAYSDRDDAKITESETKDRVPDVPENDDLFSYKSSTANYNHVKNHVRGYAEQEVIYTLRVYNEGQIDGYAEEITDHLPEGLEFVNDKFNSERGWKLDVNDPTLRTVKTTYLSKENNPNNDRFNSENNLIKALDVSTGVIDYKEIEIKCKISKGVKARTVLTNIAEISLSKANNRTAETVDRDSHTTPGATIPDTSKGMQDYKEDKLTDNRNSYVPGQEDDDDFEKIIVEEFDLALRKYITAINEDEVLAGNTEDKFTDKAQNTEDNKDEGTKAENAEGTNDSANTEDKNVKGTEDVNNKNTYEKSEGNTNDGNDIKFDREPRVNVHSLKNGSSTTASYKHTKEPMEVSVGDIVTYTLEVFNEGTVDGYASLIKDDIPEGVEFVTYKKGDGSVNDIYRWKMVNENDEEVKDPKKAKYVVSDYLSKDNEKEEFSNLIKAFESDTDTSLDSKYVQVQFRVICKQNYPEIITNYAQISKDSDEKGKDVIDRDSTPNEWIEDENGQSEDDQDIEHIRVTYMDLALRKFITGVTDAKTGETQEVTTRIPKVDVAALIKETGTTAKYEHTKDPVLVHTNDVVIYTLRIYNEGSKDGYATQIKDDLPEGLEYLPDHEINKQYEWSLVDKNDKPVTRIEDAEYAVTNYLSKDNETKERQNLLIAFDRPDGTKLQTPEYKDVKIAFRVTEPQTSDRILINYAQISEQTDGKGKPRDDRDSTPNKWLGEDDEDIEKVRVQYFDLALRKWVTKAIVVQNGKEVVTETGHHAEDDPEDVVKVDLKKSKIDSVVVKFEYKIRITNEGEIAGYAKEIKDHIPEGLRFDPADNPIWTQIGENVIVTDQLNDVLLEPGESTEVTVLLTWINSGTNLGLKVNIAEISKDYNDYGTPDIDSTPDNFVPGEDDIDDAPIMLAVKTGNVYILYVVLAVGIGIIMLIGTRRIIKLNEK